MQFGVEHLTIFPDLPGMTKDQVTDRLDRFSREVSPTLQAQAPTVEQAAPGRGASSG
ncbi:MAG: hypothetical protein IT306_06945 [Chloroflexi bacterium]|nr:hypothetical protein [Chloroflexota bacterium]